MQTRRLLILAVVVAASGVPAAPASAQSGVVVDSDSPTGQEYALPLESARREASGKKGAAPGDTSTSPLFGAGVGDSEDTAGGIGKKRSGSDPSSGSSTRREQPRSRSASVSAGRTAAATVPEGGVGSSLTIVAVALSVLLLGGVIGSIARRRSTS